MTDTTQGDWWYRLKSEPLSRPELATHFQMSSKHVVPFVESLTGTERVGRKWRVRIVELPPSYWISCGLIVPTEQNAQELSRTLGITLPTNDTTPGRTLP